MMVPVLGGAEEGLVSWVDERDVTPVTLLRDRPAPKEPPGLDKQLAAALKRICARRVASSISAVVGWLVSFG